MEVSIVTLLFSSLFSGAVRASPGGAPTLACQNGHPQHGGHKPQSVSAPYKIYYKAICDEKKYEVIHHIASRKYLLFNYNCSFSLGDCGR